MVIDPKVTRALVSPRGPDAATPTPAPESPLSRLTPSERAIATLLASGATNSEIARQLSRAEGTVKNHVSAVMRKLGIHDRTALALHIFQSLTSGS